MTQKTLKTEAETHLGFTMESCAEGVCRHLAKEAWARIGMGLYFLKAQTILVLEASDRGQGRKSIETVSIDLSLAAAATPPPGFVQFLNGVFETKQWAAVTSRTAYNYMNAARKLGLTHESTDEDIEALKAANAIGDRRMKDLYRLGDLTDLSAEEQEKKRLNPGSKDEVLQQQWFAFTDQMALYTAKQSKHLKFLARMPLPEVLGVRDTLRAALEQIEAELERKQMAAGKGGRP